MYSLTPFVFPFCLSKLAADYCQHYDPKYGNSLCGPSRTKVMEIVRFMK